MRNFQGWKTREVKIGKVGVGGNHPIRIQSMTTSSTRDVDQTVEQILKLVDHGCELVRVTVQGIKEAEACEGIKNLLIQKGVEIPLIADIHFYPPAALRVIDFVDKVRINPGNFVDKRASFKVLEYDEATYASELEKIEEKFAPLVSKCIELKKAMRIGTNHGSLSDRIMNRYGDTPFGMVESAFEYARICRKMGFHDFLFSMKSSNPVVMIEAYRLLVAEMMKLGWDYPIHLGVTEAGAEEDGRIKSAIGIGSLLLEGIGDTIRVSLTEDPWDEIDPCRRLVALAKKGGEVARVVPSRSVKIPQSLHRDGSVILTATDADVQSSSFFEDLGCTMQFGRPVRGISTVDGVIYEGKELPEPLEKLSGIGVTILTTTPGIRHTIQLIGLNDKIPQNRYAVVVDEGDDWGILNQMTPEFILLKNPGRGLFEWLRVNHISTPVLLHFTYNCSQEDFIIRAAAECGALLTDKLGEGVALQGNFPLNWLHRYSFNLLQAARMRSSKTEFISCPGCGRTLFNLQEVSRRIREKTAHLPGVKIAIMGCIVNGPGEMADADFGYVGTRPGKIDLYVGKECVEKDISHDQADERLIELIKSHGRWIEAPKLTELISSS